MPTVSARIPAASSAGLTGYFEIRDMDHWGWPAYVEHEIPIDATGRFWTVIPNHVLRDRGNYEVRAGTLNGPYEDYAISNQWFAFKVEDLTNPGYAHLDGNYETGTVLRLAGDGIPQPGTGDFCEPTASDLCNSFWLEYVSGALTVAVRGRTWEGTVNITKYGLGDFEQGGFFLQDNDNYSCGGGSCYQAETDKLRITGGPRNGLVIWQRGDFYPNADDPCQDVKYVAADDVGNAFFVCARSGAGEQIYKYDVRRDSLTYIGGDRSGLDTIGIGAQNFHFYNIHGIAIDLAGNLLLSEAARGQVLMIAGVAQMFPSLHASQTYGGCGEDATSAAVNPSGCLSDPVNTATGAFTHSERDLATPGPGVPFQLSRSYTSADSVARRFGRGWTSSLDASLAFTGGQTAPTSVTLTDTSGQRMTFRSQSGAYPGDPGVRAQLRRTGTGWAVLRPDKSNLIFDSTGRLAGVKDRNNAGWSLTYSNGVLATIVDSAGRSIDVDVNAAGNVTQVTLPDGRHANYQYQSGLLTSATNLAGATTTYSYDSSQRMSKINDGRGNDAVVNQYDAAGRVVNQTDAMGKTSTFAWDPLGETAILTDAEGKQWTDQYAGNVLVSRTDPLGNVTSYRYDADLNKTAVIDPKGAVTTSAYDSRGNLVKTVSPTGATETFNYDADNDLLFHVDPRGNATRFRYDAAGNLLETIDSEGGSTSFSRSPVGASLVGTATDARGKTTQFGYDTQGNLTTVTTPLGHKTRRDYDSMGRLIGVVDPRGMAAGATPGDYRTAFSYDALDRLKTVTTPRGGVATNTWDPNGNLTRTENAEGDVVTYLYNKANEQTAATTSAGTATRTYTARGQLESVTDETGAKTTYTYDPARRLVKTVLPRGNATGANPADFTITYTLDSAGNRTTITEPLGRVTQQSFDANGQVTESTDPLGRKTTFAYNESGQVKKRTDALLGQTSWTYDEAGAIASETDPLGNTTAWAYDANGNLTSSTDPTGSVETRAYDADNRLIEVVAPRGNEPGANRSNYLTAYGYDAGARLTAVTDPLGHETTVTYDRDGNRLRTTDARGNATSYTHDLAARLVTLTDANSAVTSYDYDGNGRLAIRTDPRGKATQFGYDGVGRLTTKTDPLGRKSTWTYDENGNLTRSTDAIANAANNPALGTTTYAYDAADRLTSTSYSDGTAGSAYEYDAVGNRTKLTEIPAAGCPLFGCPAPQTYLYDKNNQLTKVTRSGTSFVYTYDAAGNVSSRQQPGGTKVTYGYDAAGRMASATIGTATTDYDWDAEGHLTSTTQPNGVTETRTWDRTGRLSSVTSAKGATVLSSTAYQRDPNGNPTQITDDGQAATLTYDPRNQVTSACYAGSCANPEYRYTYDAAGNMLSQTTPAGVTTYTHNNAGELLTATTGGVTAAYQHDANGRMIQAGSRTFEYDAANQLVSTKLGTSEVTYSYDGDGNRVKAVSKTGLSSTTATFKWDINGPMAVLATMAKGSTTRYYYGVGLIRQTAGSVNSYPITDAVGSVTGLVSNTGVVQRDIDYDPFGNVRSEVATPASAPTTALKFTGSLTDETGRQYLHARTLDPKIGRFDQPDPLDPLAGETALSPYTYANNAPTTLVDPTGLRPEYGPGCTGAMLAGYYDAFTFGVTSKFVNRVAGLFGQKGLDPDCTGVGQALGGVVALVTLPLSVGGGLRAGAPRAGAPTTVGGLANGGVTATRDVDHIVLGLRSGLDDTAALLGGRTLLDDTDFMATLLKAIADPSTRFTVVLDGMSGATTYAQVMNAAQRGTAVGRNGWATDWEMAQLLEGGRLPDVTFMRGGVIVENPWAS